VDFKVLFSTEAVNDLSEIVEFIAPDSPEAASRFGQSLINHVKVDFPKDRYTHLEAPPGPQVTTYPIQDLLPDS